jgi:hypothetical protein
MVGVGWLNCNWLMKNALLDADVEERKVVLSLLDARRQG